MYVFDFDGEAIDHETLTPTSAIGISATMIEPTSDSGGNFAGMSAKAALITVEAAAINFSLDGVDPTAAAGTNVGHQLDAGQSYVIRGLINLKKFRCIERVAANGATVKVTTFA
jgi:hypothetical protein